MAPRTAHADVDADSTSGGPAPLTWKRTRFSTIDYVVTGSAAAVTLAAAITPPQSAHAKGAVLFDDDVRDALRAPTRTSRSTFRAASDVGVSLELTWPLLVDALASAWWYRGSRDVAAQMVLIDLETFAVNGAVQGVTNGIASRERPYGAACGGELPSDNADCSSSTRYRSFFSGHTSFSFTGAALVCFHHLEQQLLGGPWDALSCAGAYAVAATTGAFRVVSDVHYATDVLAGAAMGTLIGYGVPLLHLKYPNLGTLKTDTATVRIVPSGLGAGVVGIF